MDRPLPSEQAVTGEVLGERRRSALRAFRDALGPCPESFEPEDWAVVMATLAPEASLVGKGRADRAKQARDCFPGLTAPAALRAWLEVSQRPHVAQFIADFRALEAVDVMAQREQVREVLTNVMMLGIDVLDLREVDPSGAAKCGAAAAAAAKVLVDLDGLRAPKPAAINVEVGTTGGQARDLPTEDPFEALSRKVALVAGDVRRRQAGVVD